MNKSTTDTKYKLPPLPVPLDKTISAMKYEDGGLTATRNWIVKVDGERSEERRVGKECRL